MNNTVHIFFNGSGVEIPPDNAWEAFGELDALRTFLICAESWRANGWEVKRLSTLENDFTRQEFISGGRVEKQYSWYGQDYWQFIAKARAVAGPGINWFATMDVINRGYSPSLAEADFMKFSCGGCLSAQKEHFSLSFIGVTWSWLLHAENILLGYDRGKYSELRANYISDERILREYSMAGNSERQKFACNAGDEPLIHFARSTLARTYNSIPLS